MNINYYRNENWVDNTFSKRGKKVLALLAVIFSVGIVAGGCGVLQNFGIGGGEATPEAVRSYLNRIEEAERGRFTIQPKKKKSFFDKVNTIWKVIKE